MESDSSEDDMPLSMLRQQAPAAPPAAEPTPMEESESDGEEAPEPPSKKAKAEQPPPAPSVRAPAPPTAGDDSDDSDDVPLAALMKKPAAAPKPAPKAPKPKRKPAPKPEPASDEEEEFDFDKPASSEDDAGDSSDDDVPLSQLAKRAAPKKPAAKRAAPKKRASSGPKESAAPKSKKQKGGLAEQAFYQTLRGQLLQHFLRRWWYAVEWPSAEAKGKLPADGYEALEGFPGVHVCTKADHEDLGKVVDHRDHAASPCFLNYYVKPSAELKALCLQACEAQLAQLLEAEPDNDRYISKLKADISEVKRIDPDKADREAAKAVQHYQKDAE